MSTNLDKSLDEIIKSKPRRAPPKKKASNAGVRKVSSASKSAAPAQKQQQKNARTAKPVLTGLDQAALLADRVILSNIPLDINEASIKEYFTSEIGPVRVCQATYNAKGKRTGVFSLTFAKPGLAAQASNKFNGTAIDGNTIMKVELVMDPSKKPLSARIKTSKQPAAPASKKNRNEGPNQPKKAGAAKKAQPKKKGAAVRRPKKTKEELDTEMNDYFKDSTAPAAASV